MTSVRRHGVLFLCTGNSARSILAEAVLNKLGQGRFQAFSAGSFPKGQIHPGAMRLLARLGYPTDGLRSKSWNEFAGADAPQVDTIVTVCDAAAGEVCPVWPGGPTTAHWGLADPAAVEGDETEVDRAFQDVHRQLLQRIGLLVQLQPGSLDRLALKRRLRAIHTAPDDDPAV